MRRKCAENEEARALIDMKILQSNDTTQVINLKRQRNTLVPIYAIPPEVLCMIFITVYSASKGFRDAAWHPLDWVNLTHVCHWWREVAMQERFLWNDIPIDCPGWADEMLKRSNGAPLTVTADFVSMRPTAFRTLQTTLLHISRIHELNIRDIPQYDLQDMAKSCVVEQALPLHTIRIIMSDTEEGFPNDSFMFPDGLEALGLHLTSLRRLGLKSCRINWTAPVLCNVTHLRLSVHHSHHCYRIDSFLDALQMMPALELLDFEKFGPEEETETALSNARKVPQFSLPNLKFLRLGVQMHPFATILFAILPSSPVVMCLYCYESTSSLSTFPAALSSLSAHLQSPNASSNRKIQTLEFTQFGMSECKLQTWQITLSQKDIWTSRIIPSGESIFSWDRWETSSDGRLAQVLFDSLQLGSLVTLSISLQHQLPMDAPTWARTFGTLPLLEFLDIDGENAPGLFEALTYRPSNVASVPFPSLNSLSISKMGFDGKPDSLEDSMIGILIERRELGLEIRQLLFRNCPNLLDSLVDRFRRVINVEVISEDSLTEVSHLKSDIHPFFEESMDTMTSLMGMWS